MSKRAAIVAGLLSISSSLHAQVSDTPDYSTAAWGVSAGFNRAPVLGLAVTGFAANDFHPSGVPLRGTVALDFLLSLENDSPYVYQYLGGDGDECYDTRDGSIAEDYYCVPEVDVAGRAELMAVVARHWGVGGGARLARSADPTPYGLVRYESPFRDGGSSWFGQLSLGERYSQVDAGISVRF